METSFEFNEGDVVRVHAGAQSWSGVFLRLDMEGVWFLTPEWTTNGYRFSRVFVQSASANPFAVVAIEGEKGKDAYLLWKLHLTNIYQNFSFCLGLVSLMEDQARLARVAFMVAAQHLDDDKNRALRAAAVKRISEPKILHDLAEHQDAPSDVKSLVRERLKNAPAALGGKGPYR